MRKNGSSKKIEYCSLEKPEKEVGCFIDTLFSNEVRETAWYCELLDRWFPINMGVTASYTQQEADDFNRCLHQEITIRSLPKIIF